jgi:hypothetical protein
VGGQKMVPRPSANYFVVSRRQKGCQKMFAGFIHIIEV